MYYENVEFNFATGQTAVALSSLGTTFLSRLAPLKVEGRYPSRIEIRTNQTISVRLVPAVGLTTNDDITIASTDSPFVVDGIEFGDVLITNNSGLTAAIKMFMRSSQY